MKHKNLKYNKKFLTGIISITILSCATSSYAANWLMLQGTESQGQSARAKLWGFIQTQYQKDTSTPNAKGQYISAKLIGPNLNSQQQFNVNRARIGVRGTGFPLDSKVNYSILVEFGNNGLTASSNRGAHISDASITLNYIPGVRIRTGLFKTPGSEESMQAIQVSNYINYTTVTNQLLLERFPEHNYTGNNPPVTLPGPVQPGAFTTPVGAFRDTGVQFFDAFRINKWENSYAIMYGNGNGLNFGNYNGGHDLTLYLSSEYIFAGKGGRREGVKMFVWHQSGKRLLDNTDDNVRNPQSFNRDRSGLGFKYLRHPWRVTAEYMQGTGMIFVGPDKPTFDINGTKPGGDAANARASGYYLEGGWYIPDTKWEINARYDTYDRMKGDKFEFDFKTITLGTQYIFNKKTRLIITIADRSVKAVNFASGTGPNANLDGINKRYAIQLTHVF